VTAAAAAAAAARAAAAGVRAGGAAAPATLPEIQNVSCRFSGFVIYINLNNQEVNGGRYGRCTRFIIQRHQIVFTVRNKYGLIGNP
jgi:hypothetical protein